MMESVGVYGFCGCKAKNKMKCDSRWEIAASAPPGCSSYHTKKQSYGNDRTSVSRIWI
ncbi:heat shock protein family A (Hsp70) member 12A [Homo sapiens]|uniref:Heat shock protein family A (Hsp70) member 12A n=1 Tax=Homo sapiens TaxID=9606 RepID=A0A6I8PLA6_HUMAN|nr:heat shock protein family A (Hsp70) member 12A [Homo sapiens]KAI4077591.1 heat shock protein family A (Hsp70) member 12A [Homo sapiens]